MYTLRLMCSLLFLLFFTNSFGQNDPRSWIIQKMEIHSPNSIYLLRAYDQLPRTLSIRQGGSTMSTTRSTDAFYYLQTGSREAALSSMGTNVHEIGHGYAGVMHYDELMRCNCDRTISFSDIQKGFYQAPQEQFWIDIERNYIFPSSQLRNTIPSDLITFRFKTYITGNNSTQNHGVIGLLDEMNAYYLGSQYKFDMFPVYKEMYADNYLNKWVQNSQSEMTAFFEFDFFIKEYLLFAKYNYPATYQYLKNNPDFRNSYKKIHDKYNRLVQQYEAKVASEKVRAELYYDSPFWEDDYYRLRNRLNSGVYDVIKSDFFY
jgi:hypothetical protein